ncbi:MAG: DNA recombination protein RmuC, partial [Planctomycetia bacterium]
LAHVLSRARHAAATAAASAALQAQLAAAQAAQARLDDDVVALRQRLEAALAEHAAAKAGLEAHQARVASLESSVADERRKAEAAVRAQAGTLQDLGVLKTQVTERERSLAQLQATVDQARAQLADAFKATGADVLKQAAESLLQQAKAQFEGHAQLSQQQLEARQQAIEGLVAPLKEQLVKQEALVKELGEKREGDTHKLGEQLKQVAELQQKASHAALALSSAMRDNRQRGRWGEVTLRNVVELAGMGAHVDFSEQSSVRSQEGDALRPDMIVRLPGARAIPIDAKVPMSAYLEALDAGLPEAERARRREAHAEAVRAHVRTLRSRAYAEAVGGEIELTVMFVPVESALVAALEADGTLFKDALEQGVVITTPSTLLALLRTCALQWQQATIHANARKIGEHAKELLERIQNVAEDLQRVGKGLEGATRAFNEAVGSYNRRLVPKARDTAELAGALEAAPVELELQSRLVRADVVQPSLPPGAPAAS